MNVVKVCPLLVVVWFLAPAMDNPAEIYRESILQAVQEKDVATVLAWFNSRTPLQESVVKTYLTALEENKKDFESFNNSNSSTHKRRAQKQQCTQDFFNLIAIGKLLHRKSCNRTIVDPHLRDTFKVVSKRYGLFLKFEKELSEQELAYRHNACQNAYEVFLRTHLVREKTEISQYLKVGNCFFFNLGYVHFVAFNDQAPRH
jgi:hypothetical protein